MKEFLEQTFIGFMILAITTLFIGVVYWAYQTITANPTFNYLLFIPIIFICWLIGRFINKYID